MAEETVESDAMGDRARPFGLTSAEAAQLLAKFGANTVEEERRRPLRDALEKFWAPVPWMLEAAILLQLALGERIEAAIIGALLFFNAALGFFQQSRAQAALEALRSRLALNASVLRDGKWIKAPASALVPQDVVKLSLGAIAPADIRILDGSVSLDQSMLTGESAPVERGRGELAYASALVRRGEAVGIVSATGKHTFFGRTAELVRLAHSASAEQQAVFAVVRNLALLNSGIVILIVVYALAIHLEPTEIIRLVLTAVLASIPVALPATFTLATALASQRLTGHGVLPTRLSAVHEAATMEILCSDKTGTLTQNALQVTEVRTYFGADRSAVLRLAAFASSEGGFDLVDGAIQAAAGPRTGDGARLVSFTPFDPAIKRSEASILDQDNRPLRILKGAYPIIATLAETSAEIERDAQSLGRKGFRVLAVASGASEHMRVLGLIALSDPPREDAKALIGALRAQGVRVVMVTGDTPVTAEAVAAAVGLRGGVCPAGDIPEIVRPEDYAVFAGVLPEHKFSLVKAFQRGGRTVGMCGDGANDAPALRQAQIGIAVSTATDVAKSAAGIVLTEPGLAGIVTAVGEGRATFQRILTYTLNTLIKKVELVLFLAVGLALTHRAVLTPILMVLLLVTSDFLTMALTTDRARPSPSPDRWQISRFTAAALVFGICNLIFATLTLAVGWTILRLNSASLRTLSFVTLVFAGQATIYAIRERQRLWSSRPSLLLLASSAADISIATTLAWNGFLMHRLSPIIIGFLLFASILFSLGLDQIKIFTFRKLQITHSTSS